MKNVRETILMSSKELFLKNGYSGTTIRGIIKKSGVLSGSIYHFFGSKEDIFKTLILELFDSCEREVISIFAGTRSQEFLYIVLTEIELRAVMKNERIRELYYEAYTSDIIFEKIVEQGAKKSREIFEKYNPNLSLKNYYDINLMIKGAMRSCIVDCKYDRNSSSKDRNNTLFKMMLMLMNVPCENIENILKEVSNTDIEIGYITDKIIKQNLV